MTSMTLTPAYGRDYPSKESVIEAFYQGKDFLYHGHRDNRWNGKPINRNQIEEEVSIQFRYGKLRKVFTLTYSPNQEGLPNA